jgi:hypothetical protein
VAEIALDSGLLLLIYNLAKLRKRKVTRCNMQFGGIAHYGKYCAIWEQLGRPQDMESLLFRP